MSGDESQEHPKSSRIEADQRLVNAVSDGSLEAWHEFVLRFSGLIHTILRKHLFAEDDDDIRSTYVDVLEALYNGALANYGGKAPLSTWLMVFTRGRALDFVRHQRGRYREPKSLGRLSEFDKEVLRLYYVERKSLEVAIHVLKWAGHDAGADDVVASIQHIEASVDRRFLTRLDNAHVARQSGARSITMLKYLIRHRQEYDERVRETAVDAALAESEARREAERVRELLSRLPADERRALNLRYAEGMPAKRIASEMGLDGPRKAYTLVNRAIRRLQSWIVKDGIEREVTGEDRRSSSDSPIL